MFNEDEHTKEVPCGNCTICCQKAHIVLHPEQGDDPTQYEITKDFVLLNKPDGSCIYLGKNGCTIYNRRPFLCRFYDCRKHFLQKQMQGKPQSRASLHGAALLNLKVQ